MVLLLVRDIKVHRHSGPIIRAVKSTLAQGSVRGASRAQALEYLQSASLLDVLRTYDLETPCWSLRTVPHDALHM
jgi:hypothetical protein